jgi:hypothetical protein
MRQFRKPSAAMVVACISLAVALGGVSYAAVSLPKNSVGPKQLRKNAVSGPKVLNKSLGSADIKQATLGFGKSVSIPGLAFVPRSSGTNVSAPPDTGCITKTSGSDALVAPLSLPQGARVKRVVFNVLDNSVSDMSFTFSRYDAKSPARVDLRSGTSAGVVPGVHEFVLTGSPITVVNNARYTYGVEAVLATTLQHLLCDVRIEYTLP